MIVIVGMDLCCDTRGLKQARGMIEHYAGGRIHLLVICADPQRATHDTHNPKNPDCRVGDIGVLLLPTCHVKHTGIVNVVIAE